MCNFHPLGVVGRGSETQLQVGENLNYLIKRFNSLRLNMTVGYCSSSYIVAVGSEKVSTWSGGIYIYCDDALDLKVKMKLRR